MAFPPALSRALTKHLEKECDIYEQYLRVLDQQRASVTKFDREKLIELDDQRRTLTERMQRFHEQRLELMSQLPGGDQKRLSALVDDEASPKERTILTPLVDRLRYLVASTRQATSEFQTVQNFALNVVNGSLSLLARATKHCSKQYGKDGAVNESYVPRRSRKEGIIKEA